MREQLARAGDPLPEVIGIDELSLRKGHIYRILVSDLIWRRGPVGRAHGHVLRLPRGATDGADPLGRDGHVEAVPERDGGPCRPTTILFFMGPAYSTQPPHSPQAVHVSRASVRLVKEAESNLRLSTHDPRDLTQARTGKNI